jgi:hypothetical protein
MTEADFLDQLGPLRPGPQQKDSNEIAKAIDSTPLFMTQLPTDGQDNDTLAAIQSLIYDGPPEGINFYNERYLDVDH